MRVLLYKDLNTRRVKAAFTKVRAFLEADDFRSADVKKLSPTPYWRAKLDYSNRLLLQFARYGSETVCLALEVIENHAYDKSRFLRGAAFDEEKIEKELVLKDVATAHSQPDTAPLRWLHASRHEFDMLDKPIMFDDAQEAVRRLPAPVVVVGSAGSGKTAVTLTKLREAAGRVLYVTLSSYLAQSARTLYDAHGFQNPVQEPEFLSYREFVETLRVPTGREVTFTAFSAWFERHRQNTRNALVDLDAHALFEEFRGVITAGVQGPLDLPSYLALGARQSLLDAPAREAAHGLFQRYQEWLAESKLYDLNLVAFEWRALTQPVYDFVVIDEVQDLTNVQLALVLACLKTPGQFLLCGDSNQIVHPNFFSWAAVRTMFWHGLAGEAAQRQTLSVLQANFRNTRNVTELANTLLKIKQARFGSIDRESNFLVQSTSQTEGAVRLLPAKDAMLRELDGRTRASVHHAVVVLRDEDKAAARARLHTPLVFSVHEAKGLEYPHVILFTMISNQRAAYAEVCEGVALSDLQVEELNYNRARDKGDKSLELYKFYVNALYVAMTRAVESLTLVESDTAHPLLDLLGLKVATETAVPGDSAQTSSREEWAQEARKLELQGKEEQARAIRDTFLQVKKVPWTPWSQAQMEELVPRALDRIQPSNKPRQSLMDYALWHGQQAWVEKLAVLAKFEPARTLVPGETYGKLKPRTEFSSFDDEQRYDYSLEYERLEQLGYRAATSLRQRHLQTYLAHNFKDILRQCDQYGVDHHTITGGTPLMLAAVAGNLPLIDALLQRGADLQVTDEFGHTAWMAALNRAIDAPDFARQKVGALFERIAPAVIDVQTDGRLVRLERHQGEYWLLGMMLAGLKTLRTHCVARLHHPYKYEPGFFAEALQTSLECLPEHLWPDKRRKRSYVNAVLARAEVASQYQPARKLWLRIKNGHYLPNPSMQLRTHNANEALWQPAMQVLNLNWVDAGTKRAANWSLSLSELIEKAQAGVKNEFF
ncbi:MAG: AAA family ATPase [Rhodoferax sp.]|uniref:AAA family ATPase n=1 Tax=Rhodoferax sp. TaxID=50421 RepID=UPI0026190688|nr:AAA family ATPase [Rhodoferax sp.]MDD2880587.1 AAA family ATPase [Rhodoferax sp.]